MKVFVWLVVLVTWALINMVGTCICMKIFGRTSKKEKREEKDVIT